MSDIASETALGNDLPALALSTNTNEADMEAAQYITFSIGDEEFGVDIVTVQEIKGWTETTNLPSAPPYMLGVLNLRGIIVPIYDLRARFGLGDTIPSQNHVIVIVMVGDRIMGILVDAVSDILTVGVTKIRAVPEMGSNVDQRFLSGLVAVDDRMVALLELKPLFGLDVFADDAMDPASSVVN